MCLFTYYRKFSNKNITPFSPSSKNYCYCPTSVLPMHRVWGSLSTYYVPSIHCASCSLSTTWVNLSSFCCCCWILPAMGLHCMNFSSCGTQAKFPWGIWDLSSPTRDSSLVPCIGRQILNHWTSMEVPNLSSFIGDSPPFYMHVYTFLVFEAKQSRLFCNFAFLTPHHQNFFPCY